MITRLRQLRADNRKILSLFLTAGFPTIESTAPLAVAIAEAGADILELGIPFSDPIADGPTIQFSSETALRNGVTLMTVLKMVREIRRETTVPIVLMGYANSVYSFGMGRFFDECGTAGVDGTIVADLPLEESDEYRALARHNRIATIFLASPTTPIDRLRLLDETSTGFLYCISITGVTGNESMLSRTADDYLKRACAAARKNPVLAGFGISTQRDARRIASLCDGVVIGSALARELRSSPYNKLVESATMFTSTIRQSLDSIN